MKDNYFEKNFLKKSHSNIYEHWTCYGESECNNFLRTSIVRDPDFWSNFPISGFPISVSIIFYFLFWNSMEFYSLFRLVKSILLINPPILNILLFIFRAVNKIFILKVIQIISQFSSTLTCFMANKFSWGNCNENLLI